MTKTMRVLFAVAAVALMVVAFAGTAQATSLVVNDPSFENLAAPATDAPVVTGYYDGGGNWVSGNDFLNNRTYSGQWAQVNGSDPAVEWQPTAGSFAAGVNPTGSQVLSSYSVDAYPNPSFGGEAGLLQTLYQANPVLGYLQAGMTYTVTVDAGKVLGQKFEGVYPGFADPDAGGEIGNASLDSWFTTDGTFQQVSYSFNSDSIIDNNTFYAGDRLAVLIDFGGGGAVVDNVSVTAVPTTVPEPSTLALLAAGMIGLLAYAWRKRK
jgi:hypothetical protein